MISKLRLHNFKCFLELPLNVGTLTVLSGINSSGKSSVLQSLLLLRQSWMTTARHSAQERRLDRLALNGELVQIGTAKDALYSYAEDQYIEFEITFSDSLNASWSFAYDKDADVLSIIDQTPIADSVDWTSHQDQLASTGLFGANFQYLGAERLGPRTSFSMSDFSVRHQRQLGAHGEFTTHYLTTFGTEKLALETLAHPDAAAPDLRSQVEAWMNFICPGTRLKLTPHSGMDLVQLEYQFVAGRDVTDPFRPTNVGFGLTYTLPILVAVLAARPGSLLLLENPESHLHPQGQARMGEFLAKAASAGVQIFVETHSDHVLNGIRLAVHENHLAAESVRLHFFLRKDVGDRLIHDVITPRIDRNGRIDKRPEGFFDEWDRSLNRLLKPAKR